MTTWGRAEFHPTPFIETLDFTKEKRWIKRVDTVLLFALLTSFGASPRVFIERPMVNPGRFKATGLALRAFEATLITLERLRLGYVVLDSRKWQSELLPAGCEKEELKPASMEVGCRLFPSLAAAIRKHKDADSLLMAEYARRNGL